MSEKGRPLFYIEADKILYKEEDGEHKSSKKIKIQNQNRSRNKKKRNH